MSNTCPWNSVRGHSGSLKMAPSIDHIRLLISLPIVHVSIALSYTISRYLTLKNIMTLKSRLEVIHPANLYTILFRYRPISLNSLWPGAIFLQFWHARKKLYHVHVSWSVTFVQGYSFKVIKIGANWKPICEFLLVFIVFPRYNDLLVENRRFSMSSCPPNVVWSPRKEVPLGPGYESLCQKNYHALPDYENRVIVCLHMVPA